MHKKYVVRLTDEEREELQLVIKKWKGLGQKVRRTQVLLKADVDGPGWTDEKTGEAYGCRVQVWVSRSGRRKCSQAIGE